MAAFAAMSAFFSLSAGAMSFPLNDKIQKTFLANPLVASFLNVKGNKILFDKAIESNILQTSKFKHYLHGLEVIGSGVNFHINSQNKSSLNINLRNIKVPVVPKYNVDEIRERAKTVLEDDSIHKIILKILPAHGGKPDRLIYELSLINGGIAWFDAVHGTHIATIKEDLNVDSPRWRSFSAAQIGIISTRIPGKSPGDEPCTISDLFGRHLKKYNMIACLQKTQSECQVLNWNKSPVLINPALCKTDVSKDDSAARADANSEKFLDYFALAHGYNSYDGKGAVIVSVVHAGVDYANASWSKKGNYIAYGEGDGITFGDFTKGVDVAGHEMTHALIQNTAGLLSIGEPGALNESLADYFGEQVEDRFDWNIGADLFLNPLTSDNALRDLSNPSRLNGVGPDKSGKLASMPYPNSTRTMAPVVEPCIGKNDFCGVHYNSTVPGHAWYLIHEKLGKEDAEAVIFIAMTHYFNEITDFKGAAAGTILACQTILEQVKCNQVADIFHDVGML